MTRYIAGQPIAAPLILPASPWERKPLPVAPRSNQGIASAGRASTASTRWRWATPSPSIAG